MPRCTECGQITGPTWDGVCRACYDERHGIDAAGHHDDCGCSLCVPCGHHGRYSHCPDDEPEDYPCTCCDGQGVTGTGSYRRLCRVCDGAGRLARDPESTPARPPDDSDAAVLRQWTKQSYDPPTDYAGTLSLRRLASEVEVHETDGMCGGGPVG